MLSGIVSDTGNSLPAGIATAFSDSRTPVRADTAPAALHPSLARGLVESEAQFRQIVEGLRDVVALTNETGTQLLFVNAAYEHVWGRQRSLLYANPLAFLDGVHPDDRARVRAAMAIPVRAVHEIEFRVVRPDGKVRWVWSRGFPVHDSDGRIYRIVSITEDVTERRQVIESHQRLVRGFTHDVKNPLGAADGFLALMEMGVCGEMGPQQSDSVRRARRSIRAALELVGQMLDIERAEAGQLAVARARVDLGEVARDIIAEFRAMAEAKRLCLKLRPTHADESLVVESDPSRLRQILANLVSNAVKYAQADGHISVRAHVGGATETTRSGRWLAVDVEDDGPGIPLHKQSMLFREFTRFDPGAAEGSGVGLAISQRLAFALGGRITFTSEPGKGSTFTLWIPDASPSSG